MVYNNGEAIPPPGETPFTDRENAGSRFRINNPSVNSDLKDKEAIQLTHAGDLAYQVDLNDDSRSLIGD